MGNKKYPSLLIFSLLCLFFKLQASDLSDSDSEEGLKSRPSSSFAGSQWDKQDAFKEISDLIEKCDSDYSFPFARACERGCKKIVQQLVEAKKIPYLNEGLEISALNNQYKIVKYLVEKGANDLETALLVTSEVLIVKYLIKKGANNLEKVLKGDKQRVCANSSFFLPKDRELAYKKIHYLEKKIKKRQTCDLSDSKKDLQYRPSSSEDLKNRPSSSFAWAKWDKEGTFKEISDLIEKCDSDYSFPFACACGYGFMGIVQQLVEEEKIPNLNEGLEMAALYDEFEIVKYLVEKGANNLETALLVTRHMVIVKYLIKKGANNLEQALQQATKSAYNNHTFFFPEDHDLAYKKVSYLEKKIRKKNILQKMRPFSKRVVVKRRQDTRKLSPVVEFPKTDVNKAFQPQILPSDTSQYPSEIKPLSQVKTDKTINIHDVSPLDSITSVNRPISQPKKAVKIGPRKFKPVKSLYKKDKNIKNRSTLSNNQILSKNIVKKQEVQEGENTQPVNTIISQPKKIVTIGPQKFKLVKNSKKRNKK